MGSKHKVAQAARREARRQGLKVREQLMARMASFNEILREKPKWVPLWLWQRGARIFIDTKALEAKLTPQPMQDG